MRHILVNHQRFHVLPNMILAIRINVNTALIFYNENHFFWFMQIKKSLIKKNK